ncbi:imidazolonepropionase [Flavihumibacter sp. R14]|nr:imidazolonepropionase [Flavihumibacter soli]
MSSTLITHIKGLVGTHSGEVKLLKGADMGMLPVLADSWLLIEDGKFKDFGEMGSLPSNVTNLSAQISAKGKFLLPAWCDSHTHLVFAASREEEFVMKIRGQSYEEIAAAGGGILNSAAKVQGASEDKLFESAWNRLEEVIRLGTGAIEIKSGYGLTADSELKMLRVIRRLKEAAPVPVKATFLGAHAYPANFKNDHEGYLKLLTGELIPQVAGENLADYIDVFCEQGFFTVDETSRILEAGAKYGLKAKIHANQLSATGAVETGVAHGALSVDHLEVMNEAALSSVSNSDTIATLLPSCSLFLGIPFADARSLISRNTTVALASDFNPGSTPSGNMNLVVSLACMRLKMLPEEAINAATINGAAAMDLAHSHGSIARGKAANFFITHAIPSLAYMPYSFGSNHIERVFINGKVY